MTHPSVVRMTLEDTGAPQAIEKLRVLVMAAVDYQQDGFVQAMSEGEEPTVFSEFGVQAQQIIDAAIKFELLTTGG